MAASRPSYRRNKGGYTCALPADRIGDSRVRRASQSRKRGIHLRRILPFATLIVVLFLVVPSVASAQGYTFTVNGLLGIGGSIDESDPGFGNFNWQLGFTNAVEKRTHFGIRVGGLSFGSSDQLGDLTNADLNYITLAGEYRERAAAGSGRFMESGVFLGLGYFQLKGDSLTEASRVSEGSLGLVFGVTGDLPLNRKRNLALRIEVQGQWADLDNASLFALGQVGISYRF